MGAHDDSASRFGGDRVAEWVSEVPDLIRRIATWRLPEDVMPDMSRQSLEVIGQTLIDEYTPDGTVESRDFLLGAVAYVGESLMHAGGGTWIIGAGDHVLVRPDAALRSPATDPIDPLTLIRTVLAERNSRALTECFDTLRTAAIGYASHRPGWKPTKIVTRGLDPVAPEAPHPALRGWLAERRASFELWATGSGIDRQKLDFTPASLGPVGEAVVSRYGSDADLERDEQDAFVQGCVWYVGEVAVRHRSGSWAYRPAPPDLAPGAAALNPFLNRPFVNQPTVRDGAGDNPLDALLQAVGDQDPAVLRRRLDWYKEPPDEPVVYLPADEALPG